MIYDRTGATIEILDFCGRHERPNHPGESILLRVRRPSRIIGYEWEENLKADGGVEEIDEEIDLAPEVALGGDDLAEAMREAD